MADAYDNQNHEGLGHYLVGTRIEKSTCSFFTPLDIILNQWYMRTNFEIKSTMNVADRIECNYALFTVGDVVCDLFAFAPTAPRNVQMFQKKNTANPVNQNAVCWWAISS